jgi:hypothetical protein
VNHAIAETAFVQQFELHADMVGERLVTAPSLPVLLDTE